MRQVPQIQKLILFLIIITDELSFWILLPVLVPLIDLNTKLGLTHHLPISGKILYGIILGSQPLLSVIAAPFWGFISDQLGRRKILFISLLGSFVGYIFYCLSFYWHFLVLLIIARVIIGSTTASQAMVQTIIAADNERTPKLFNIATMALVMTLPIAIGPLLSEVFSNHHLSQWLSLAAPFVVTTGIALFNLLLFIAFCRKESHYHETAINFKSSLSILIKNRRLQPLLVTFFVMELFWGLFFQSAPLMLSAKYHFNSLQIAIFISALGGGMMLCLMVLMKKSLKKIAVEKLLLWSLLIEFLAIFAGITFINFDVFMLSSIGIAMSIGLTYVCLVTRMSEKVAYQQQGLLMGTTNAILASAFGITGLLSGLLSSVKSELPLIVCGGLAFVNCVRYAKYYFSRSPHSEINMPVQS